MKNYDKKEKRIVNIFTQVCGLFTAFVGFLAILGWILRIPILTSFSSGLIPMAPSTALLFISFGVAVLLRAQFPKSSWYYNTGIIIGSISTLIALLLFFLSSLGIHLAVEHLGFKIEGSITGAPFGYISPLTALCFVLAGFSFLITLSSSERQKKIIAALSLASLVILTSIILLLAHLFGTPLLYGTQFIPPALSTSFAFFFLGTALLAFISPKVWRYKSEHDAASIRSSIILILVFVVLAAGIISAGYFYYIHNEKEYRSEIERRLSSVADLKMSELVRIRKEWHDDASFFYKNTVFSTLVDRYFNNPKDIEAHRYLRTWLSHFKIVNEYNKLGLLDAKGVERFALPDLPGPHSSVFEDKVSEAIKSGKITIADFYRNEYDQHIYLNLFVPITDPKNNSRINGVLSLQIDPESFLYPYINSWPTPSKTSETILVRREGNDVMYLNELRFKKNTALTLAVSLKNKNVPAVRAVLGEQGIVEGLDYIGVPVLADIHVIPNSPWFIVTKTDMAEVYAPLGERLWMIIFLITALLFGTGTSVAVVWRHQRARFYRERLQADEKLRESHELLERVFNNTHIMMAYLDIEFNFIRVNQAYAEADGHTPDFFPGKNHFELYPYAENKTLFRKVVETGQSHIAFAKPFEYAEHPERGVSYWDWSLQPVKANDGSVTALIFSLINVTERMQAQERIQKLNRVYAVLSNINQVIVRIHDINQLFNEICRIAIEDGKFRMAWIGMVNTDSKKVEVVSSAGFTSGYLAKINIDLNDEKRSQGPTGRTIISGSHSISNDIEHDESMIPWRDGAKRHGYKSSASFPIKVFGKVRGVFNMYSSEVGFFDEDEIKLLDELVMDISFALEFIEREAQRKEAEEFLLKFRMGIERSGDAVFLTDPDGTITYVNPAFEKMFGYTKEEAIGKTPRILKSGTLDQEYYRNFWDNLLTQKPVTHEIVNKTKDGRLLSIEASINPIINKQNEIIGFLAIERDITERKRAEEALRKSEEQLELFFTQSLAGFFFMMLDGPISWDKAEDKEKTLDYMITHQRITKVNDAMLTQYRATREQFIGLTLADFFAHNIEQGRRVLRQLFDTGHLHVETNERRFDGTQMWLEGDYICLYDANRCITGQFGVQKDITERKLAEEALRENEEHLRTIIETEPECVKIVDRDGQLLEMNAVGLAMLEAESLSEVQQHTLFNFILPEYRAPFGDLHKRVMSGENGILEFEVMGLRGTRRWLETHAAPMHDATGEVTKLLGVTRDITERKRAEEILRESEERFRNLVENINEVFYIADGQGKIFYCSPNITTATGYSLQEIIGKSFLRLVAPIDRRIVLDNYLEQTTKGESDTALVFRVRCKDGKIIWVEQITHIVYDTSGNVVEYRNVAHDITERKRAEEEIWMLANALKSVNECVSITDLEDKLMFVNESFKKTYGFSEEELIGKNMLIVRSPNNPPEIVREILPATIRGGWNGELWNKRKDGSEFPIYLSTTVINDKNGKPLGLIGVAKDITERKRAEQEIISQKNRFVQLFENSPIAIALLDDQDKIILINESFSALFGYFLEEIRGQSLNDLIVPPELKEEAKSYSDQTREGNQINKESYRKKKDGTLVYVQIVGVPVNINDKTVGIYGMYVDLTQRKEAEDKMKSAKELAVQSDKLKSEFLAQMSHEIRTPINIMTGNVDYLKDLFSEKIDAEANDCFVGIDIASKRIIRTIDLILNVAELQTSSYKPQFVKVDLDSVILNKLYKEHQLLAKQIGLELIYTCKEKDTKLIADEYSITQIFANLIDNAIKYTKKGKVEILLDKNSSGNIMVEIKDTGIGMSKEFLLRMFEPFLQEDRGFTRSYDGSGLGLALVKNYCDINNAVIEVESEKGVGTTFRVIFE